MFRDHAGEKPPEPTVGAFGDWPSALSAIMGTDDPESRLTDCQWVILWATVYALELAQACPIDHGRALS